MRSRSEWKAKVKLVSTYLKEHPPLKSQADETPKDPASSDGSTDDPTRAAKLAWGPAWRPPGQRGWPYYMIEHAFFGVTRSKSPGPEAEPADSDKDVKKGGEV